MHTISGLLHADHRMPSLDYAMIMKATMHLTKNKGEGKKPGIKTKWSSFAKDAGVSITSSKLIDSAIEKIIKDSF